MKVDPCPPGLAGPAPDVLSHDRKRSLTPPPVDIRNGEPTPKMARIETWEKGRSDAEVQVIERLQELLHGRAPFATLLPVACRSKTLVSALNPVAGALLADLRSGKSLGPQQYEAISAGFSGAMQRSGLFEPVG